MQIHPSLFGISGRGATSKSLYADVPRAGTLSVFFWIQQVGHEEGNHVTREMSKAFALTSETVNYYSCKFLSEPEARIYFIDLK